MEQAFIYTTLLVTAAAIMWGMLTGILMLMSGAKDCRGVCLVVPLTGHMEDAELVIRETVARTRRLGLRGTVVYVADFGADGETAAIAERLCREYDIVEWVTGAELAERIAQCGGVTTE